MSDETIRFHKIKMSSERSGKCAICGKRRKRSITIWKTVNPWNKNRDGTVKTECEVRADVISALAAWERAEPFLCATCDGYGATDA